MTGAHRPPNRPGGRVAWEDRRNEAVLRHLQVARGSECGDPAPHESSPDAVDRPYMTLGAHPDLVQRLWDDLGGTLPLDCRWVVWRTPSLVHPQTGVIFASSGGTHTYALRLPAAELAEALASGAPRLHEYPSYPALGIDATRFDLATVGAEWVFGRFHPAEPRWCAAAFEHAGLCSGS